MRTGVAPASFLRRLSFGVGWTALERTQDSHGGRKEKEFSERQRGEVPQLLSMASSGIMTPTTGCTSPFEGSRNKKRCAGVPFVRPSSSAVERSAAGWAGHPMTARAVPLAPVPDAFAAGASTPVRQQPASRPRPLLGQRLPAP